MCVENLDVFFSQEPEETIGCPQIPFVAHVQVYHRDAGREDVGTNGVGVIETGDLNIVAISR
jgi:hypothetical protein